MRAGRQQHRGRLLLRACRVLGEERAVKRRCEERRPWRDLQRRRRQARGRRERGRRERGR
eukprot:scaffold4504_cov57-Phaeocystis_antarctica.AAC.1